MKTNEFSNPMRRQVWSLPELMVKQYEDLEPKTRTLLTTPEIFSTRRIILTGCGDSFAAALAARGAFEQLTNLPVEVLPAIDVARHFPSNQIGKAPNTPLLIAISNSGEVARVAEAVMRMNRYGGFSIGVTGKQASLLGREATKTLGLDIPAFESAPGVRTCLVSMLSLLLLAIRIGEVRGTYSMDEANTYRKEIPVLASRLENLLETMDEQTCELSKAWKDFPGFDFIGAGPDYASAWYGHAKILEATGRYAMYVNTEEWLHLNFFIRDAERTGTILIVDKNSPSLSRAKEVAAHIAKVGRPFVVLSNGEKSFFPDNAHFITVPDCDFLWMSPIVSFAPVALLAGYIAAMLGEEYGRGGRDNWSACQNGATTKDSEIIVL